MPPAWAPSTLARSGGKRCEASVENWIHRASLPYLSWMALKFSAIIWKASSQLMASNSPLPRSPTRFMGRWIRASP